MVRRFRAHFDGRVFVPDEPVNLPKDQPVEVAVDEVAARNGSAESDGSREQLQALRAFSGSLSFPPIPPEALRRENLYDSP